MKGLAGCFFVLALAAGPARAVDLGAYAGTYPIAEPDFLLEMRDIAKQSVRSGAWRRLESEAATRAQGYFERPPAAARLARVKKPSSRRFDPSITLSQDLRGPDGTLIFPAGTAVNPADIAPFPGALLFLDGDDTAQVAVAERLHRKHGEALIVVLVDGSPGALMRKWERPVYFDQGGEGVRRFGVQALPTLITQAKPADRVLTIEEIRP